MRNLFLIFIIFSPYMLYSQIEGYVYGAIDGKDKVPLYAADVFFKKVEREKLPVTKEDFFSNYHLNYLIR